MSGLYQSGRNGGMGARRSRDQSKVRANSNLPKGNQYTTPERDEARSTEREKKRLADQQFVEGRKALQEALQSDPDAIKDVWATLVKMAKDEHYKAAELVLGYAYGKPIATQETFNHELSGDDLFDVTEQVGEQLASEGWTVLEGGKEVS